MFFFFSPPPSSEMHEERNPDRAGTRCNPDGFSNQKKKQNWRGNGNGKGDRAADRAANVSKPLRNKKRSEASKGGEKSVAFVD